MENEEKKNKEREVVHTDLPACLSFGEARERAASQVGEEYFDENEKGMYRACISVMAEVYMLHPRAKIAVEGEFIPAEQVQGVFVCLTEEHLRKVISFWKSHTQKIYSPKKYLRTALYNAVFELDAAEANEEAMAGVYKVTRRGSK